MALNLAKLLAQHYSTDGNSLTLQDSDTIRWEFDGFGNLKAHLVVQEESKIELEFETEPEKD